MWLANKTGLFCAVMLVSSSNRQFHIWDETELLIPKIAPGNKALTAPLSCSEYHFAHQILPHYLIKWRSLSPYTGHIQREFWSHQWSKIPAGHGAAAQSPLYVLHAWVALQSLISPLCAQHDTSEPILPNPINAQSHLGWTTGAGSLI